MHTLKVPKLFRTCYEQSRICFSTTKVSFHKRPLPSNLTSLSSSAGKVLFREALELGCMESYFPLAEQFITQSDPSYCSLSTLAMVLNALNFDPKKIWKGSWRWVSEEMLQCETEGMCGHSLERVKKVGLSFSEFESLGHCHGVKIQSKRVKNAASSDNGSKEFEEFRNLLINISSNDQANRFLVTNFSRKFLNQTGDGHYSPIGGYHKEKDLALVMDVARFKYPPYWVKLSDLWDSMSVQDKSTGESRGYFLISGWEINSGEMKANDLNFESNHKNQQNCCTFNKDSTSHNHQHHHHNHHNHSS